MESPLRPELRDDRGAESPAIRVFYPLHKGVLITDTWFCAGGVRFAIADMDRLWERNGHIQRARRAALEVIVAAYRSGQEGRPIELPLVAAGARRDR